MAHAYDFFVASLVCPVCGQTSPSDTSTNMQTYLCDEPDMASLKVGNRLILNAQRICEKEVDGYQVVKGPEPDESIRILETWACPSCCAQANWAEVVIHNGVIQSICAITFDREHFERSHLISNECISIAAERSGKSFNELVRLDLVTVLRDTL